VVVSQSAAAAAAAQVKVLSMLVLEQQYTAAFLEVPAPGSAAAATVGLFPVLSKMAGLLKEP
jgi:hypothetical protein